MLFFATDFHFICWWQWQSAALQDATWGQSEWVSKLFSNWTEIGVRCLSSDHSRWDCCKTNIHRTGNEAVLLSSWMLVKGSAITLKELPGIGSSENLNQKRHRQLIIFRDEKNDDPRKEEGCSGKPEVRGAYLTWLMAAMAVYPLRTPVWILKVHCAQYTMHNFDTHNAHCTVPTETCLDP